MLWIERGRQIGQAVKNVQRLRQIIAVFSRYGFQDLLNRMDLGKFIPSKWKDPSKITASKSPPERLREALESLGPTFVKLGQLLSTRPDIMPDEYINELVKLQDQVLPLPYDKIKSVVEDEFKAKIDHVFAGFSNEPLASASIAQVHEARLHSGENVVVKVQRPEIKRTIETDISLLAFLAKLLEKYVPETRFAAPSLLVDEFLRTLSYELDFSVEANNMAKMAQNLSEIEDIVIPKIYRSLSTHKILTLEKLDGIKLNDSKKLDASGIDKKKLVRAGARAFFKSVMIDGLFHGDLHGGNLFALPGNRLGIIDFGIVGRLSRKARDQLANMVLALINEDYENLCYYYAELGSAEPSTDFDQFQREVQNALSPYLGLSLSEINAGRVLIEATKIATKHNIRIPSEWMIVFKAILTTEGMGRTLDPDFDLLAAGEDLVHDMVKNQHSIQRIKQDSLWLAKDLVALLQTLPRQMRWMFRKFNSNDFAFEIKSQELSHISKQIESSGKRTSLSIITAALIVASALALHIDSEKHFWGMPIPFLSYIALAVAILLRVFLI